MKGRTLIWGVLWALWSLWGLACLVLALGALGNHLASRTQTLPLALSPGASAELSVYRLIDDRLRLRLRYAEEDRVTAAATAPASAGIDSSAPEPDVLLRIETPTDHADFRAGTRSGVAGQGVNRALQSVEPDRFAASYFGYGRADALPQGRSWLRVTVLAVDPALAGRAAAIEVQPPLDLLKLTDLDYAWLWPFFFWKMAALLLLIPGAVLAVFTFSLRRWQHRQTQPRASAGDRG
ncbi:TPA: hypothetical protein ACXNC8_002806 [Stenotrophomonas maltophilia]